MALTRGFKQNEDGVGPTFGGRESLYFFLVEVKIASCGSLKGQMTPSFTHFHWDPCAQGLRHQGHSTEAVGHGGWERGSSSELRQVP